MNYKFGKIYKIIPIEGENGDQYFGSTKKKYLCQRFNGHKQHYKLYKDGKKSKCSSFDLFEKYGVDNCLYVLVENFPCETKEELKAREAYYILNNDCVNKCVPGRTQKEYYEINKEKINKHQKDYYQTNIDKIREYDRERSKTIERKQQKHESYERNKESIKEKHRKYYEDHKNDIILRQNEKVLCECGKEISKNNKPRHIKSQYHITNCV